MLLLILLPILTSGFYVCNNSPNHFYRLHRYEGQMLYLKSASLGLTCTLVASFMLFCVDAFAPSTLFGIYMDVDAALTTLLQNSLNTSAQNAAQLTWIFLLTIVTSVIARLWCMFYALKLNALSKRYDIDAKLILMAEVLSDSPMDSKLFDSLANKELIMLTLSNRKVYVGVVNGLGEPNEVEGMDQEISLVPVLSGFRDKDDLTVSFNTKYDDINNEDLMIVIRQDLIETVSQFEFSVFEDFARQRKAKSDKLKVIFNPSKNSFSWEIQ